MGAKEWKSDRGGYHRHAVYDFAESGGAQGAFNLLTMPDDLLMMEVYVVVETTLTSGGAATIVFGNVADDNGYIADIGLDAAGVVTKGAGALMTNGHLVLSSDPLLTMTIGTADLTAGKLAVYVKGMQAE